MIIRSARSTDQAYVAHSWQRSAEISNHTVNRLLDDPRTTVTIACADHDPDRILGWCAAARVPGASVLLYVLVRKTERGAGMARALTTAAGLTARMLALFPFHDYPTLTLEEFLP